MKKLFKLLTLAIVMSVVSCSSPEVSRETPSDVTVGYIKNLNSGRVEDIANLYHYSHLEDDKAERLHKIITTILEGRIVPQNKEKKGVKSYSIISESIAPNNTTAAVRYIINYGDGSSIEQRAKLLLIDGLWYLDPEKLSFF